MKQEKTVENLIEELLGKASEPLTLNELLEVYKQEDNAVFSIEHLNPAVWRLIDEGRARFTSDWRVEIQR